MLHQASASVWVLALLQDRNDAAYPMQTGTLPQHMMSALHPCNANTEYTCLACLGTTVWNGHQAQLSSEDDR